MSSAVYDPVSTRDAFGEILLKKARENDDLYFVAADTMSVGGKQLHSQLPNRAINVGIAEQNMALVAAGMASCGAKVVVASYAAFCSMRMTVQLRSFICYPDLDVKVVAGLGGLSGGQEGVTHQGIEDVGVLRSIPNLTIIEAADAASTRVIADVLLDHVGPAYLRLGRDPFHTVFDETYQFAIGRANVMEDAGDETGRGPAARPGSGCPARRDADHQAPGRGRGHRRCSQNAAPADRRGSFGDRRARQRGVGSRCRLREHNRSRREDRYRRRVHRNRRSRGTSRQVQLVCSAHRRHGRARVGPLIWPWVRVRLPAVTPKRLTLAGRPVNATPHSRKRRRASRPSPRAGGGGRAPGGAPHPPAPRGKRGARNRRYRSFDRPRLCGRTMLIKWTLDRQRRPLPALGAAAARSDWKPSSGSCSRPHEWMWWIWHSGSG